MKRECLILTFDLKSGLKRYIEDMGANISASCDEVHGALLILVPHEVVAFRTTLQILL